MIQLYLLLIMYLIKTRISVDIKTDKNKQPKCPPVKNE